MLAFASCEGIGRSSDGTTLCQRQTLDQLTNLLAMREAA